MSRPTELKSVPVVVVINVVAGSAPPKLVGFIHSRATSSDAPLNV